MRLKQIGMSTLGIVLVILLALLLVGAFPVWPHAAWGYGYYPSGIVAVILIVIVILLVTGRL